jgi:iron complex transport system substrate-binding protein
MSGRGSRDRGIDRRGFLRGTAAAVALAFVPLPLLAGCGKSFEDATSDTQVVVDSIGREVEVPVNPKSVAGLDSFAAEAMVMIGAGSQLCGCPAGVISDSLLCEIYPDLENVPVPLSGGTVNVETLLRDHPDVVFIKSDLYYSAGEVAKLDKLGIPYLVTKYGTMNEQIAAIEMIGAVCGGAADVSARRLADYYRGTIEFVKKHAAGIPESKKVRVYHSINQVVLTDGSGSLGTDWIECVGAVNVSADEELSPGTMDYFASLEQIHVWDPDVVVCNSAPTVDYLLSDPKWAGLRAVREKRVYPIPVGATRWGQRGSVETFLAMLWLGVTVYPEYYSDVDLQGETVAFYRDYLGLDIDKDTYLTMLSGDGLRAGSTYAGTTTGQN